MAGEEQGASIANHDYDDEDEDEHEHEGA